MPSLEPMKRRDSVDNMTKHYEPQNLARFLFGWCQRKKGKVLHFTISNPLPKSNLNPQIHYMQVTITNEQKVLVTLNPTTGAGHPAKVEGKPNWNISGLSTLVVAEDGMSAYLVSSDETGQSTIIVTADADLGEGVELIQGQIDLTVISAKAQNLGLAVGTPEPK